MISKEELKKFILENCIDENWNIDLSGLDFSDFDGNIYIDSWKVKRDLVQSWQEVEGDLFQNNQEVKRNLFQDKQKVENNLYQDNQEVKGILY